MKSKFLKASEAVEYAVKCLDDARSFWGEGDLENSLIFLKCAAKVIEHFRPIINQHSNDLSKVSETVIRYYGFDRPESFPNAHEAAVSIAGLVFAIANTVPDVIRAFPDLLEIDPSELIARIKQERAKVLIEDNPPLIVTRRDVEKISRVASKTISNGEGWPKAHSESPGNPSTYLYIDVLANWDTEKRGELPSESEARKILGVSA